MRESALQTLIEIAAKESDDAAKALGRAIHLYAEAEKQLELLKQYRNDYVRRLEENAQAGLSIARFTNFQAFINKLDAAVEGQVRIILDAEYKVTLAKTFWESCEQKRLSYKTLNDRSVEAAKRKESKQDQKQTDEYASRAYFYRNKKTSQ